VTAQQTGSAGSAQWVGQPSGYEHYIEPDIMESWGSATSYGGFVHDWYGLYRETCRVTAGFCNYATPGYVATRRLPAGTKIAAGQYHRYGLLWIPASATRKGSLTWFFDGRPIGAVVSWSRYDGLRQRPPPSLFTPWTFGVIDGQHLILNLAGGAASPLRVRRVVVWQASAADDLRN
jgi:hypothetical protein